MLRNNPEVPGPNLHREESIKSHKKGLKKSVCTEIFWIMILTKDKFCEHGNGNSGSTVGGEVKGIFASLLTRSLNFCLTKILTQQTPHIGEGPQ